MADGEVRPLTVSIGAGRLEDTDVMLTLGPYHPSGHGVLRLRLTLDGERILTADPLVGYLHRGAEKLFEVRDYRQIGMLAGRHDWLSSFGGELGVALAVERMLGLEVPARAVWLRTVLAELARMSGQLAFLAGLPGLPDAARQAGWAAREALLGVLEAATGGRVHFMATRVGGLLADVPAGWPGAVRTACAEVATLAGQLLPAVFDAADRLRGVAVLSREQALAFAASGPVARASGVPLDLRRDEPYLAYGELGPIEVPSSAAGDGAARLECLAGELAVSRGLVERGLDGLPRGPVSVRLPKVLRAPEGASFCWTEGPLGLSGYYVVSRGEPTPWRVHIRTPSYHHVQLLGVLLPGVRLDQLADVLATVFFVIGDVDK